MTPDDIYQLRKEEENDIDTEVRDLLDKARTVGPGLKEWIDENRAAGVADTLIALMIADQLAQLGAL